MKIDLRFSLTCNLFLSEFPSKIWNKLQSKCVYYLKEQMLWKEIEKIWKIIMQIEILMKILPIPPIIYSLIRGMGVPSKFAQKFLRS